MPSGVVTEREVALELPDVRDPKLIQHCAKLCVSYNLSAQQLADKWETMQMNSAKASQPMTFDLLGEFEKVLEKVKPAGRSGGTAQKRPLPEARTQPMAPRAASFTKDSAHLLKSVLAGDTPKRGRTERGQPAPVTPILLGAAAAEASPTSSFASRTDAGKVATALNAQLGAAPAIPQVSVSLGEGAAEASRPELTSFMYERLDERARRMDGAVEALERDLIVQHGSKAVAPAGEAAGGEAAGGEAEGGEAEGGEAEAGSPAPQGGAAAAEASPTEGGGEAEWPPVAGVVAAGPEAATFVGRVCSDSEGGKLNPQSVWLEGSRSSSGACRARLDLSECAEYALFPGQVVAVRGVNLLGHTIRASRVLCGSPPPNASPPSERDITPEPFNVITATGPFTCSDDLSFAPLDALLEQATSRRALALVLVGPFVEADHPALAAAEVGYEDLFEQRVMLKVEAFLAAAAEASPHAPPHVVLVPSPRDVLASPVYPQPPLPRRRSPEQIAPLLHFAPNPAAIDVGGVRIAVGSLDSLLMIGSAELASAPQPGAPRPDRLLRLASHVLQQRSFLPLLPPPADLPVDMAHNFVAGAIDTRPDILLLPSQLAPFAKVLPDAAGGALCVNAGRLTRNAAGGNYATLSVHPRAQVDGARTSDIAPRVAVEIAKI